VGGSNPEAEYEETMTKAAGFLAALNQPPMNTNKHGLQKSLFHLRIVRTNAG
jgi:hypothetical protein